MKATTLTLLACMLAAPAAGQVASYHKINDVEGGFAGTLYDGDGFGSDVAPIGDLDGNGTVDLAVGAAFDDYGGTDLGAVWILYMNHDGSVLGHRKIAQNLSGFTGTRLSDDDRFGHRIVRIGDLNGDHIPDLSVAAPNDDDGSGVDRGALYTLFLFENGTVMVSKKISSTAGGLTGGLHDGDQFGQALDALGDLNGDGYGDLVVGAHGDDDGGSDRGAIYLLRMNGSGTLKSHQKISSTQGGFLGALADGDRFGSGVATLGDVDGDGVADLAVGAAGSGDGGAVWILFLNADGTVRGHQAINRTEGGASFDYQAIGTSVAAPGDLDGDDVPDLLLGDPGLDGNGEDSGGIWVLFLNADGTVRETSLIDPAALDNGLAKGDVFPSSLRLLGDLNGDGAADFGAGHAADDGSGPDRGAAWLIFSDYEDVSAQKLVSPANGATDVATNLTATWAATDGAMSYTLQVALTSDFASPVRNAQGLIGTSYPVTGLAANTAYYWRVQPASLQGFGDWSATWVFTTGTFALATPTTLEPAFGASGLGTSPTLSWTPSPGASGYDLVVSNSPTLDPPVVSLTGLTSASRTIGPLEILRAFYWRVRATSPSGDSPWSDVSFFSTGSTAVGTENENPYRFDLGQNYPNPFNPQTVIPFDLPVPGDAVLSVSDVSGRIVQHSALGFRPAGRQEVTIDAGILPSGVYWYTLVAGSHHATRRMVVLR